MDLTKLDEQFGSGSIITLGDDREQVKFIPYGQPWSETVDGKNGPQERILFPVISTKGVGVLPCTPTSYRALRPLLKICEGRGLVMTRHGEPRNPNTSYDFDLCDVPESVAAIAGEMGIEDVELIAKNTFESWKKTLKK